mgnify:CR=1 FL=1
MNINYIQGKIRERDYLYEKSLVSLAELFSENLKLRYSRREWEIILHYFLAHWFIPQFMIWKREGPENIALDNKTAHKIFPTRDNFDHQNLLQENPNIIPFVKHNIFEKIHRKSSVNTRLDNKSWYASYIHAIKKEISTKMTKGHGVATGLIELEVWSDIWSQKDIRLSLLPGLPRPPKPEINVFLRNQIACLGRIGLNGIPDGFFESLAMSLPTDLLEDLPTYHNIAVECFRELQPSFIQSSLLTNPLGRYFTAYCVHKGVPFFHNQHGGAYGEPWHFTSDIEARISDHFISWDWRCAEKAVKPGPCGRLRALERFYKKTVKSQEEILIIGAHSAPHLPTVRQTICGDDYSPNDIIKYCWNLPKATRRKVKYRFRRQHGYISSHEHTIKTNMPPEVTYDYQEEPIYIAYSKAEKVLIERPFTTSEYECRFLGIPYMVTKEAPEELKQLRNEQDSLWRDNHKLV